MGLTAPPASPPGSQLGTMLSQELDAPKMLQFVGERVPGVTPQGLFCPGLSAEDFKRVCDHFRVGQP